MINEGEFKGLKALNRLTTLIKGFSSSQSHVTAFEIRWQEQHIYNMREFGWTSKRGVNRTE